MLANLDPVAAGYVVAAIVGSLTTGFFGVFIMRQNWKQERQLRTTNGKTIGEHVDDLVTWSHIHTEQDNEIRVALGLPRAEYPNLQAWRNIP